MTYFFKFLGQKIYSNILKLFYLYPVKKNRILFVSFGGKNFTDNPKYIFDYMVKNKYDCEFAWAFKDPKEFIDNSELKNCKIIKVKTFEWYLYFLTSKVVVLNDTTKAYMPVRKEQCLINTWHGGGTFKKTALSHGKSNAYERWIYKRQAENLSVFISSSQFFTENLIRKSFDYHGFVLETGMPRNAVLLNEHDNIITKVREYFDIPKDNIIVLYAPTFRSFGEELDDIDRIDIERCRKLFEYKYSKKVTIFYRAHYHMSNNSKFKDCVDATQYPDMQELLCAADVLITDYSSSMWDFSLMKKPAFIYAHDLEAYTARQGFYLDISKWPYPYATNMDDFENIVNNFNQKDYVCAVDKYLADTGSFESRDSLNKVVDFIKGKMDLL